MPTDNSYRTAIPSWEETLAACIQHAEKLPDLTAEITALGGFLNQAKALRLQQDSATATRQVATQELRQVIKDGQEVARRIRDAAKFKIGQRSERLVQFKVKPLRPHARKAATAEKPETVPEKTAAAPPDPAKP
jgi:hypothetical protein